MKTKTNILFENRKKKVFEILECLPYILIFFSHIAELLPILKEFTEEKILSRIHYYGCHDYQTLLAIVHHLPELLKKHKKASTLTYITICLEIQMNILLPVLRFR